MTEPPPRKCFQKHLSTAIVMMFVAGGLIWANTRERKMFTDDPLWLSMYGWPDTVLRSYHRNSVLEFSYESTIINGVIALNILYVTYRFCEWLIRRSRAARKGS